MVAILGAGGPVGTGLGAELAAKGVAFRVVSRNPRPVEGAQELAADLSDPAAMRAAVDGADVACLLVGLKYDTAVWKALWPRIMRNAIDACRRTGTKLLFFDNVYMYGRVAGAMTEATPYRPCSAKGEIRAQIATALMDEVKAGTITAMIARSADFYGPNARNGIPNLLVFEPLAKHGTASWLLNASVPHSLTFTPDAARGVAMLIERESAWNQIWHLPTAPEPPTGTAIIEMAAAALGARPKSRVLGKPMLRLAALFDPRVRESLEMLYQYDAPYVFDATKFARAFGFAGTPYGDGIRVAAAALARRSPDGYDRP